MREEVLVKAKKLYPAELSLIRQRIDYARQHAETELYRRRLEHLEAHGQRGYDELLDNAQADYHRRLDLLGRLMHQVERTNEPTVVDGGDFTELWQLAAMPYVDLEQQTRPLLTEREVACLTIRRGSLAPRERREIEDHVEKTYQFLKQIPWTADLRAVPDIAYGHHEKLNGAGYPRRLRAEDIPVQTRMMTIADIFDALTAADRPYKKAVSVERALDLIAADVEGQMLDPDLFQVFVDARVYESA